MPQVKKQEQVGQKQAGHVAYKAFAIQISKFLNEEINADRKNHACQR